MKKTIKVVDINEILPPQKIVYNESVLSIYHDKSYTPQTDEEKKNWIGYWPVNRSTFKNINDAHFRMLEKTLK